MNVLAPILFFLSFFLLFNAYSDTKSSCESFYQDRSSIVKSYIFNSNGDFTKKTRWLREPHSDPLLNSLVFEMTTFSPMDRVKSIDIIRNQSIKDRNLRLVLLLASYDKKSWQAFLNTAMRGPLEDDSLVNSLIPVLRNMPQDLKNELVELVKPRYRKLTKRNFSFVPFRMNLRLAPRRAIDALFLHLFPAREWIEQDMQTTGNSVLTYDRYLRFLKETLFDQATNGGYSSAEVLTVARAIQKVMIEKTQDPDATIWITGSFPNGRAKIKSTDLDSQLSDRKMISWFPEINKQINQDMKRFENESQFVIEAMWETTTPHFAAQINPIFLKITPSTISLDVYSEVQPYYKDRILLPVNYNPPKNFVLETRSENPIGVVDLPKRSESTVSKSTFLSALDSRFADYNPKTNWLKYPSSNPQIEKLVRSALMLTDTEKAEALIYMDNLKVNLKNLDFILRLALFDKPTWDRYFDHFSTIPQDNDALFNSLTPVIKVMPETLKRHLLARVQKIYPSVRREKWVREGLLFRKVYKTIAPKRALDILINQLLPAKTLIQQHIHSGSTAIDAYNRFIKLQHDTVYPNSHHGDYHAAMVLEVAKIIQANLRKFPKLSENEEIILAGSFPSGRANLKKSDIDIQIPNIKYEDFTISIEAPINEYLQTLNGGIALEVNSMFLTTTRINAALVSPIQIRITRDEILLEVFGPIKNIDRDEVQLPKNYEKPLSVELSYLNKIIYLVAS